MANSLPTYVIFSDMTS